MWRIAIGKTTYPMMHCFQPQSDHGESSGLTLMASTVALKTGLLCFTLRQYLGLLGQVKLQPYFSSMFRAVDNLCRD